MLCRVLRTKQAKHVRRSAPIFTSIILDAQEKSAKRKRADFFAASCGCESEALPAAETAELEQGPRSEFSSALRARRKFRAPQPGRSKARRCLRQKQPSYNESEALPAAETAELEQGPRSECSSALHTRRKFRAPRPGRNSEDRKPQQGIQGAETGFPEGVPARHAREAPQEKRGCFCARARPRAWQRVRPKQQAVRRRM